ncbi:MAG: lysophospholipid acyltransferase family protein [Vulcanimicrobiaceae bacterium]
MTFFDFARGVCGIVLRTIWRMRVVGSANVPRTGALIVACNHVSYLDPPALGAALPRRISYMAKHELFSMPVLGPLMPHLRAFPVDRSRGDVSAIRRAVDELRRGAAVGVFPEGTRNRDGRAGIREGVALLAALSGAPVLPAYVDGSGTARRLGRITVVFGQPIRFVRGSAASGGDVKQARRAELAKWTSEVMDAIRGLREKIE